MKQQLNQIEPVELLRVQRIHGEDSFDDVFFCISSTKMKRTLQKIIFITIFLSVLLATQTPIAHARDTSSPAWVDSLQVNVVKTFNTTIQTSQVNSKDYRENKVYSVTRLKGEGTLQIIPDPFKAMSDLFLSDGWKEDWRYLADKHGGSSTAYRKDTLFCIVSVDIDSGDDDELVKHVPSSYWFSMDCRETK
jgi:hypothetical protein